MNYRKKLIVFVLLSVALIGLGYVLIHSESFGICDTNNMVDCIFFLGFNFGEPLYFGLIPLIPILLFLLFFPKEVFTFWAKFAVVLIPIIILIIVSTPVECNAPLHLCFDKKSITRTLSEGFSILSFLLVVIKAILLKKKSSHTQLK